MATWAKSIRNLMDNASKDHPLSDDGDRMWRRGPSVRKPNMGDSLEFSSADRPDARKMLRERNETIARLEKARLMELQTMTKVQRDLDKLRTKYQTELYKRDLEITSLKHERKSIDDRLAVYNEDVENEAMMRDIAEIVMETQKEAEEEMEEVSVLGDDGASAQGDRELDDHPDGRSSPGSSPGFSTAIRSSSSIHSKSSSQRTPSHPGYVTQLQSKLVKAMHKMNLLTGQIKTIRKSYQEQLAELKEDLVDAVEEKAKSEVDLLNKLDKIEHGRDSELLQMQGQLDVKQEHIETLETAVDELKATIMLDGAGDRAPEDTSLIMDMKLLLQERIAEEKRVMEERAKEQMEQYKKECDALYERFKEEYHGKFRVGGAETVEEHMERVREEYEEGASSGSEESSEDGSTGAYELQEELGYVNPNKDNEEVAVMAALVRKITSVTTNMELDIRRSISAKETQLWQYEETKELSEEDEESA
mmetsp:Transcript_5728/g.10120  ORF Transcript_5728/g.10120 Transcript_5728/m.10120 type:complete len:477 (-) Transcript_5728:90-1520(-)|eukprot:CAMPEP_0198292828 /NCGR_PEP_ID=MMETSP1449-20131203/14183_1 /TAXON_ID=420275 /ORGANISM="Attheya septentrionalis, Strain CCMP2084" /LENGTH=476 /DNA_ID=CAMNT_0043992143 /DNA_START=49 /DNA_END=1479 /DNA_ORIENTATION=-